MSLPHILLGMLAEPHSGYDLKKHFEQSLRNFWNAELSQIYPQLKKLESDGLLTSEQLPSENGPPRRVYTRSAAGRRELLAWLAGGPKVGDERIGYAAQVYFLGQAADPGTALEFMQQLRKHMAKWLESLQLIEDGWSAADPRYPDQLPDRDFYPQLTLAMGLRKVQANVDWCDECIARIRAREQAGKRTG